MPLADSSDKSLPALSCHELKKKNPHPLLLGLPEKCWWSQDASLMATNHCHYCGPILLHGHLNREELQVAILIFSESEECGWVQQFSDSWLGRMCVCDASQARLGKLNLLTAGLTSRQKFFSLKKRWSVSSWKNGVTPQHLLSWYFFTMNRELIAKFHTPGELRRNLLSNWENMDCRADTFQFDTMELETRSEMNKTHNVKQKRTMQRRKKWGW